MGTSFWHGYANARRQGRGARLPRGRRCLDHGRRGNRYLDATAGLWYANVGFGRGEIADAVAGQIRRLSAYSSFGGYTTEPTVQLAARIAAMAPVENAAVFFTSGDSSPSIGSQARPPVLGRAGPAGEAVIVARQHAYHGMAAFGTSLVGSPSTRRLWDVVGDIVHVGAHDLDALGVLLAARGAGIAAFIAEPVIGAGGVIPPEDYWPVSGSCAGSSTSS